MDQDKEEQIRKRAYEIWEAEGRPEDRHHEHWERAKGEGMFGDGTEEQNLNQTGNPEARITQEEVEAAFGTDEKAEK